MVKNRLGLLLLDTVRVVGLALAATPCPIKPTTDGRYSPTPNTGSTKKWMRVNIPIENGSAVAAAHTVGNFGSETLVVHKEKVDLSDVVDKEFL